MKATERVEERAAHILGTTRNPMTIMQGIVPVVMAYMKTRSFTEDQAIDVAARLFAIIELHD